MGSLSLRNALIHVLVSWCALSAAASADAPGFPIDRLTGDVPSSCAWEMAFDFDLFSFADIAVDRSGRLIATGSVSLPGDPQRLLTLLSDDGGSSWRVADVFPVDGSFEASGHRLDVDGDGSIYVLAWMSDEEGYVVFLRRGDPTGEQWQTSEQRWKGAQLGALRSDRRGRVHVALGFASPELGVGWTVESAPGAVGRFRVEDVFVPDVARVFTVIPRDIEQANDGSFWVSGQINGEPDRWVTRMRAPRRGSRFGARWRTVDLFELSATSYGLSAAAVVPLPGGQAFVAGFGVEGGARQDYQWLERTVSSKEDPTGGTSFQLEPGFHSMALDATLDPAHHLLVAGTASGVGGNRLQVRRSRDRGASWDTLLSLQGNTSPWNVRIAAGPDGDIYVGGGLDTAGVILRCRPSGGATPASR